jgi:hypothetical protein
MKVNFPETMESVSVDSDVSVVMKKRRLGMCAYTVEGRIGLEKTGICGRVCGNVSSVRLGAWYQSQRGPVRPNLKSTQSDEKCAPMPVSVYRGYLIIR